MNQALILAKKAKKKKEVPVGALIVQNQRLIATGFNQKELLQKASAHAEIIAIEMACKALNSWRLSNCTLYVTLEPCLMCAGAILQARIKRLVYGCQDPKAGAVHSLYQTLTDKRLNHKLAVTKGILYKDCQKILRGFFQQKRQIKKRV